MTDHPAWIVCLLLADGVCLIGGFLSVLWGFQDHNMTAFVAGLILLQVTRPARRLDRWKNSGEEQHDD